MSDFDWQKENSKHRINNPDQLQEHISVCSAQVWLVLFVMILIIGGILAWGIFGTIDDNGTLVHPIDMLFSMGMNT